MPKRKNAVDTDGSVDQDGSAGRQGGKKPRDTLKSSFAIRITASKVLSKEILDQWISGSVDQANEPDIVHVLKSQFASGRIQLEKGEGGVAHFQCTVLTGKARQRRSAVRSYIEDNFDDIQFPVKDYCEACDKVWASLEYCQKDDTHIAGPWEWGLDYAKNRNLTLSDMPEEKYKWQQEILDRYDGEPPSGTSKIHWYVDPEGQKGKTELTKWLALTKKWYMLDGGPQKMKFQAAKNPSFGYFINLTRTKEDRFSYEGLESISDGIFCDTFGSDQKGMVLRKSSWIVVMANWSPDLGAMSEGRIIVYDWDNNNFKLRI